MQLLISTQTCDNKITENQKLEFFIAGMANGDTDSLRDFYSITSPSVYCFAMSIIHNEHDAQDILQDTYIKVFSAAARYKPMAKPMAWLLTITRNLALEKLRERKRISEAPIEEELNNAALSTNINSEDKLILDAALNKLSKEESEIVILHAVAGLKHREIAQILGMLLPTVLSKYNRAIKKLKNMLGEGY